MQAISKLSKFREVGGRKFGVESREYWLVYTENAVFPVFLFSSDL